MKMRLKITRIAPALMGFGVLGFMFFLPSMLICQVSVVQQSPAAQSSSADVGVKAIPEDFASLKIGPGFLLDIKVYDEPDLNTSARVDEKGYILLPLVGRIHVADLASPQVSAVIQRKYKEAAILNRPQITVNILEYAGGWITVTGEVNHPGRSELLTSHRLLDVLATAGGETVFAADTIEIRRHSGSSEFIHYRRSHSPESIENIFVNPGDSVIVHRAGIVYVLGAVTRPGGYLMQEDGKLNSSEALALAQGMVLQASVHTARVIRQQPDGSLIEIPIKFAKGMKAKVQPIQLQSRDIVYVDQSLGKNILSSARSVVGSATSAVIYAYK